MAAVPNAREYAEEHPEVLGSTSQGPAQNYLDWDGDLKGYLQYKAFNGTDSDYDRFMNFLINNYSVDKANAWTAQREDTQYQRLVADLKAAGINPYVLLQSGGSPVSSSSATYSSSGSYASNEALKKEANSQKWLSLLTTVLTTVIMAAAIAA